MKIRILFLFSTLLFFGSFLYSQNITQLYVNENFESRGKSNSFECIISEMDISNAVKVADYLLSIDKSEKNWFEPIFADFMKKNIEEGANSFAIDSISYTETNYLVYASAYALTEEEMDENESYYDTNSVFIFGNLNTKNPSSNKKLKVNKEKKEIPPYTYLKYNLEAGDKLRLSVGGLMGGMDITLTGGNQRSPRYYGLGGFKLLPGGLSVGMGGRGGGVAVGVHFSAAQINTLPANLGMFIVTVLDGAKSVESQEEINKE